MKASFARKRLASTLAVSLMLETISPVLANAQMTDISNHWAKNVINEWVESGRISGYEDGTFKPNKQITRAEFIVIVNKALGFSKKGEVKFNDVKSTAWYYKDLEVAFGQGYISGTPDGKFLPNKTITRAEAVVMLNKVLMQANENPVAKKDEPKKSETSQNTETKKEEKKPSTSGGDSKIRYRK